MTRFEELDQRLLTGFERRILMINGKAVLALIGGSGPPLLMLHGDPQTHLCWHRIAPHLVKTNTVVLTDIRGRGETHKPETTTDVLGYSKRVMANEQLGVMHSLGFSKFSLVGHDRGARVARRLALDHPESVERLVVMDIIPALDLYEKTNAAIAQDYFYFYFLTQPYPYPESLINGDPRGFILRILTGLSSQNVSYDDAALELYIETASTRAAINAMCACFRAGLGPDRDHDAIDRRNGRKIECPTLVMWGESGVVGKHFDVQTIWDSWCDDAQYASMPSGHFIPEEAPGAALAALNSFL